MRKEKDFIGEVEIPAEALYGINSYRAQKNFPDTSQFNKYWFKAMATVKRACYLTAKDFFEKAREKYNLKEIGVQEVDPAILNTLIDSAMECEEGNHYSHFIVPAVSGGAGTSINMNVNEILTNLALIKLQEEKVNHQKIDPIEHANIFQSTNDIVPTALRVAAMRMLNSLEESINRLRSEIESKEQEYRNVLRMGYTQMQEAVPSTYGQLFSSYSDMFSRDWWRVSKCHERIKVVNLGGSATGSSLTVPRYFVNEVVRTLQKISDLPVTRGENLCDATSNLDSIVEVHAILKAHAVNLEKMVNDLRLLSSDIASGAAVQLPKKQIGSSIMPGKVNPVIPEFVISAAHKIYANDQLISGLAAQGCLELNAYLPIIGDALLNSLELLIAANETSSNNLISELTIDKERSEKIMFQSPGITTSLLPWIGYHKAAELAKYMKEEKADIFTANQILDLLPEAKLRKILTPANLVKGGYSLKDLTEE